jgi:uncharacterized RDD family membrane protein YckC
LLPRYDVAIVAEDEGDVTEPATPPVRWTPPPTMLEVPGAPGLAFADVPARLIAYAIDAAIVGTVGTAAAIVLGFGETTATTSSRYVFVTGETADVSFALVGLIYFVFFWTGGRRATIGQRIFDIQVGNAFDGRQLTLTQATRRWIGYGSFLGLLAGVPTLIGVAGVVQVIWIVALLTSTARSQTRQGFHDRFANSALVRPPSGTSGGLQLACLVILIVVLLLLVASVLALIYLGSQMAPYLRSPGTSI